MEIIRSLLREKLAQVTIALFFVLSVWWVIIFLSGTTDASTNHAFGFLYGGFSLWGGVLGFHVARKWGGV